MRKLCHRNEKPIWFLFHFLVLTLCLGQVVDVLAQPPKKEGKRRAGIYYDVPYGYSQVGNTQLYSKFTENIDFIGYYDGAYYSSTYADRGYRPAMQVDQGYAQFLDCTSGSVLDGVSFNAIVEEQAELARVSYVLTNNNDRDVTISLGVRADVQIGNNDYAPIYRRKDTFEQTYGLTMTDGYGAQLCVLFGTGLAGVTSVDDYWFAHFSTNSDAYNVIGNYTTDSNNLAEGGGYDSGMGWCWKNRLIPAGATVTFSFLIGVGEVNLEPNSSFAVTPDDPAGWNDLSLPHSLTINGSYESPAGLEGRIEYAVEGSDTWLPLTEYLNSGDEFSENLIVIFDSSRDIHTIRFRTSDKVGNTTMLHPIEYIDVRPYTLSGVEDKVYTGDSIFQDALTCNLENGQWTTVYHNNVNVGVANVNLEGVFPYTIGRKPYFFNITPKSLTGSIVIDDDNLVFNREYQYPSWHFTDEALSEIEENKDYKVTWNENFLPGSATITVEGIGNYEGTISTTFNIKKATVTEELYSLNYPDSEINYDGEAHGATVWVDDYVGVPTLTYVSTDGTYNSTEQPSVGGEYNVYLEIAEGVGYLAMERILVTSFTIYQIADGVWAALQTINNKLGESGSSPWDFSEGIKSVSSQPGITIEQGRVTSINLAGGDFSGQIPMELFSLVDLEQLNLSGNNFDGDLGSQLSNYIGNGGSLARNLKYIDISGNQLTGNIGEFANGFNDLQTLYAHDNCFSEVKPMISPSVVNLTLSGQKIPGTLELSVADIMSPDFLDKLPTIITYDHGAQMYRNDINLLLMATLPSESSTGNWALQVNVVDGLASLNSYGGAHEYTGQSGNTLYLSTGTGNNSDSWVAVKLTFDIGDVNFSGDVNVLDLQAMINYIFKAFSNPFNYTAANIWTDQTINVQDVIGMVNTLMDMNLPTQMSNHAPKQKTNDIAEASVFCDNGTLYLNTTVPVAAFDIFVSGSNITDINQALQSAGMSCTVRQKEGGFHIIGYSMSGAVLPEGMIAIAQLSGQGTPHVTYVMLSDQSAKKIPVLLNNDITGLNNLLAVDTDVTANTEGIVLLTKKGHARMAWSLYNLGGSLIDKGVMRNITAGRYILYPRTNLQGQTWILKVSVDGEKEMIKKINIR